MSGVPREFLSHYVTLEREVLIRNDGIRLEQIVSVFSSLSNHNSDLSVGLAMRLETVLVDCYGLVSKFRKLS